ncbi:hypothetical protein niasHT_023945 [Heterodera trifolii]|uniref:Uncharacterized protein n=1 Tax=Heterodera trifolii TaxID=157864 RepID=A0ABD2JVH3_9BILA
MSFPSLLAFCFASFAVVFAKVANLNNISNTSLKEAAEAFGVQSSKNAPTRKSFMDILHSEVIKNGKHGEQQKQQELEEMLSDVSEYEKVTEAALGDNSAQIDSPAMSQGYEAIKALNENDKPMADLLHKLYNKITELKNSIDKEESIKGALMKRFKHEINVAVTFLANRWTISLNETKTEQMSEEYLLAELAKFWQQFKASNELTENKYKKRFLQLMKEFVSVQLDNGNEAQKKRRRRRRRGENGNWGPMIGVGICLSILLIGFVIWSIKKGRQSS